MSGSTVVYAVGLFSCILLFGTVFGLVRLIGRELTRGRLPRLNNSGDLAEAIRAKAGDASQWSKSNIIVFCVLTLFLAVFLLRPHEHTFQGLDSSAYRLMAKALVEGRPLKSVDETLMEVPPDVRRWLLLLPSEIGRITRDRSFEIESLDSCLTKPFFYPLLPLCMLGFDILVPGEALDYMVPVLGLIFCATCLAVGISKGGIPGALVAVALLSGSPLPAWLFRGCFVETIAGILISMSLLSWVIDSAEKPSALSEGGYSFVQKPRDSETVAAVVDRGRDLQFFALGLAVSFHNVMVVLAIPIFGIMFLEFGNSIGNMLKYLCVFIAGFLPAIFLTVFVATPYGQLNLENISQIVTYSASIRPAMVVAGLMCLILVVALAGRRFFIKKIQISGRRRYLALVVLFVLWILPSILAVKYWEQGQGVVVLRGLYELKDGLRIPFGFVLIFLCLYLLVSKESIRGRIGLTTVFLSLPLFLYLKGAEHMGLWSQRRLIASLLVVLVCCLPFAASLARRLTRPGLLRTWRVLLVILALCAMGMTNAVRWPAPYLVCYEKGADTWVKAMLNRIGNRLTAVDYHPYSVPLTTGGKSRVIGLSEFGFDGLPALSKWLARRAGDEEVLWVTAYRNPGLEEGVILEPAGRETIRLDRVRSKTALPAVKYERVVDVEILRVRPVLESDSPVMHKVFDRGHLALRGPWGRKDIAIKLPDGQRLPAYWSREGSGIIGPVPLPGGAVRIRVNAAAERHDDLDHQTLRIHPPWGGEALSLLVSNNFTSVSGELTRPSNQTDDGSRTGVYRIYADAPYSPGKVGIRGFANDLGALIHLVKIELVSP